MNMRIPINITVKQIQEDYNLLDRILDQIENDPELVYVITDESNGNKAMLVSIKKTNTLE